MTLEKSLVVTKTLKVDDSEIPFPNLNKLNRKAVQELIIIIIIMEVLFSQ